MGRSDRSAERHHSRRRSRSPSSRRHHHHYRSRSLSRSPSKTTRRRHRDRSPSKDSESDYSKSSQRHSHRHGSSRSERKRRRSPSPSSSEESSSSASSEDERRKRRKKSSKKSSSKDKKHKSKKKSKKKKKSKSRLGSVGNEWGKYGIIHEADIFTKEAEFQAWLLEVKKANIETLPQSDRKKLFIDFMDDYNTATMPHEKFYNLARWEARQQALRMGEKVPDDASGSVNLLRDEEILRQQHRQAAARAASSQPSLQLSKEQLDELTKVNRERVQADRMRKLGMTPKESMGVRYQYEYD